MDPSSPLETAALKLCRQALRRTQTPGKNQDQPLAHARLRLARVDWMLPDLARLIADQHARPACDFVLTARQFVDEHTFIEDAGDPVFDESVNDEAQALVEVTLRVHRAVHHQATAREDWRDVPVPPLMCG